MRWTPPMFVPSRAAHLVTSRSRRDNRDSRWTHSSARLEHLPHMPFRPARQTNPSRNIPRNQRFSSRALDGRQPSPNEPTAQNRHSWRHHKRPVGHQGSQRSRGCQRGSNADPMLREAWSEVTVRLCGGQDRSLNERRRLLRRRFS